MDPVAHGDHAGVIAGRRLVLVPRGDGQGKDRVGEPTVEVSERFGGGVTLTQQRVGAHLSGRRRCRRRRGNGDGRGTADVGAGSVSRGRPRVIERYIASRVRRKPPRSTGTGFAVLRRTRKMRTGR